MDRPESITGGCLCGSIRFAIKFPATSPWPPRDRSICQCTMCRKHTGALLPHLVTIPTADFEPPLASNPTFTLYKSSEVASRSFCSRCGSSIGYHMTEAPDELDLLLGTIDEDWLCGKQVEGNVGHIGGRGFGKDSVKRRTGLGAELGALDSVNWRENDVPGVTDIMINRLS